jgi:hypothetical protein
MSGGADESIFSDDSPENEQLAIVIILCSRDDVQVTILISWEEVQKLGECVRKQRLSRSTRLGKTTNKQNRPSQ